MNLLKINAFHGDIKPDNVVLKRIYMNKYRIVLIDYGGLSFDY